jgi:hypothetical protein
MLPCGISKNEGLTPLKMYSNMKARMILSAGLALALFMAGCEQSPWNTDEFGENVTMAEEEVASLKSAESIDSDVDAAKFGGHLMKGGMMMGGAHLLFGRNFPPCVVVSVDSDIFPKTITVDYADGCTGRFGLAKKGKFTIHMTDTILNKDAVYTVTFSDMMIGNRELEKTIIFKNLGENDKGNWVISFEMLSTTTFTKEEETFVIVREFSGTKEWLAGFETPECADDRFLRNGSGTITVNEELKFERTVTDLLIDRACKYPLSGIVEITRGDETMTIDFGTGECDNIALVTKDGESEEIELNACKFRKGFKRHERHMRQNKGWW